MKKYFITLIAVLAAGTAHAQQQLVTTLRPHAAEWERIVVAEDARARTPEQLATLTAGTRSSEPEIRRIAVRALGWLERPDLVDTIAPFLRDPAARVREQAARSLAQAAGLRAPAPVAQRAVLDALRSEQNPVVIGALVESLGRFRQPDVDAARALITQMAPLLNSVSVTQLGAVRGLYFLAARQRRIYPAFDAAETALRRVATTHTATDAMSRRSRGLATATLVAVGRADQATLAEILNDPDPYVRREAAIDSTAGIELVTRALTDASPVVRFEGVVAYGKRFASDRDCTALVKYANDSNTHVRLAAIDLMANKCKPQPETVTFLGSLARGLPGEATGEWHVAAHALLALAERNADHARPLIPRFVAHPNLFVRVYAANAAARVRDTLVLQRLLNDPHPDVRTAAVQGLSSVVAHADDDRYLAQLSQDDSQLLMTAAAALGGLKRPGTAVAMLDAIDRLTKQRRENSRDGRDSLLLTVGKLGDATLAARVQPYLRDFDPQVARHAADILGQWTGTRPTPDPQMLPLAPTPTFDDAAKMDGAKVTMVMVNGDSIQLRLYPFDAPTNAGRFYRQASSGYWDGLTLHRVEFNFVVQGGSPNANEYRGADAFSRDELAVDNNRGTIGLSTRGHDTGDGQIFINLIDNTRLDFLYTVFAEVVKGMAGVDRMLEGAQIRKIVIR